MKQEEEKEPLLGSDSECRRNYSEAFPVQYTMPDQPRQAKVSFWERRRRKKLLQKVTFLIFFFESLYNCGFFRHIIAAITHNPGFLNFHEFFCDFCKDRSGWIS